MYVTWHCWNLNIFNTRCPWEIKYMKVFQNCLYQFMKIHHNHKNSFKLHCLWSIHCYKQTIKFISAFCVHNFLLALGLFLVVYWLAKRNKNCFGWKRNKEKAILSLYVTQIIEQWRMVLFLMSAENSSVNLWKFSRHLMKTSRHSIDKKV